MERTFTTGHDNDSAFTTATGKIERLPVQIDFVKVTSDGKLHLSLTGVAIDAEQIEKIQELLAVMSGELLVDFTPTQGELPL